MSQYNKVSTEITPEMKSSALENLAAIRTKLSEVLTINLTPRRTPRAAQDGR